MSLGFNFNSLNFRPSDVLITLFQKLLDKGMTHGEAYDTFNADEWAVALIEALDTGDTHMLRLTGIAHRDLANEEDMKKAITLWMAGWTSEEPTRDCDVMSWYWRRPPKGKRKLGRKFLSTDQAHRALEKEQQ